MTYDITGQVRTSTDSNGNIAQYDYTDNLYNDPGDGQVPTLHSVTMPTNAYFKDSHFTDRKFDNPDKNIWILLGHRPNCTFDGGK